MGWEISVANALGAVCEQFVNTPMFKGTGFQLTYTTLSHRELFVAAS
jgi:hypothetical protein